tara:strand:+ start:4560 stop:5867 length:1308 start_codon:yes stop_codon:yes gene_type:complete
MSKITNLLIDTSLMGQGAESREFTVKGKPGAEFIIIVVEDGTLKYYNFETDLFELGHTSKNNLKVKLSNSSLYRHTIDFPSGGGTYVVKLTTEDGTFVKKNKKVISKNIEKQSSTSTLTLKPATVNTANYSTFPTVASTGSVSGGASLASNFVVNNASTDAGGFGLKINTSYFSKYRMNYGGFKGRILSKAFDNLWYVQSTKAIIVNLEGTGVDSQKVTAANADGISVGMELFYHKAAITPVNQAGDDLSSAVFITGITQGLNEVIITFNVKVAFENGETMTLRAYGPSNIYLNTGVSIGFSKDNIMNAETLVKTVRADSAGGSSTTITLNDTHGISGGNTISYIGVDVDNSSSNNVSVVTPDCPDLTSSGALDNDGEITVQLTQNLKKGTLLAFKDIYNSFKFQFSATINKHPESNTDILFDLDKIITVGVSGS